MPGKPRWNGEFDSGAEQQQLKRQMILREAGRAFNERGFRNVALDDVAAGLGITKTVFYYYFRDKNELLMSCVGIGFELAEGALREADAAGGSGLERIVGFVRRYVEAINSDLGSCAVFLELKYLKPADFETVRRRQRAFGRALLKVVEEGVADGSIDAPEPRAAVSWILSPPLMIPRLRELWRDGGGTRLAELYAEHARRSLMKR